jgi:hypothetical protein
MSRTKVIRSASLLLLLPLAILAQAAAPGSGLNTASIETLTGAKGQLNDAEGVFKVSVPRSDLQVQTAGARMTPPLGLTSWAAFIRAGTQTMVMGDMVLTQSQVNPVMSVALDNGLEVTALHNHFLWESPRVMFMHVGGMGDEAKLSAAIGKVFAAIKDTSGRVDEPTTAVDPAKSSLDPKAIESVLGRKGDLKDGVYKITIGRVTSMHGQAVGNIMGVNTWMAFAGSDDAAIVDGDFAVLSSELLGVLKAMRGAGIDIVSIHNHMTEEEPRIMFLHYWGVGSTAALSRGLKAALGATAQ